MVFLYCSGYWDEAESLHVTHILVFISNPAREGLNLLQSLPATWEHYSQQ